MTERVPALVFGEVADVYDRVRPAYPDALVDDVLGYAAAALDGRAALEAGAGTGRATAAFAARGVPVVAVEPDQAMADVLDRRAGGLPGVRVVRSTFEDFRPRERFGLLFSAEAWHWTTPATRWSLAADALAGGGALALFGNSERIGDAALRDSMLDVLAAHARSIVVRDEPVAPGRIWQEWPGDELSRRPEFTDLDSRHYRARRSMSKADYLGLAATRSQFRMLPEATRREVMTDLDRLFGDEVPLVIDTTLMLARRSPA